MQTFDQALIELYSQGAITEEVALSESDNPANLRLAIKQHDMGKRQGPFKSLMPEMGLLNKQQF
jgi:twitching motility protein PilU